VAACARGAGEEIEAVDDDDAALGLHDVPLRKREEREDGVVHRSCGHREDRVTFGVRRQDGPRRHVAQGMAKRRLPGARRADQEQAWASPRAFVGGVEVASFDEVVMLEERGGKRPARPNLTDHPAGHGGEERAKTVRTAPSPHDRCVTAVERDAARAHAKLAHGDPFVLAPRRDPVASRGRHATAEATRCLRCDLGHRATA